MNNQISDSVTNVDMDDFLTTSRWLCEYVERAEKAYNRQDKSATNIELANAFRMIRDMQHDLFILDSELHDIVN